MTPETSLIPDEARARIGSETGRATGRVVRQEFQRWAAAVKDRNPLYFDAEFARAHGYRDVVMPPMYLSHVTHGVADLDTLRPDGIPGGGPGDLQLPGCQRRMAGGENITFHHPVYDGDVLTSVRVIENIEEKNGRSGAFVLVTSRTTYVRQDGTTVAEAVSSMIARP
jgi:acyl dehydratase